MIATTEKKPRVVIVGGGFGGLALAQRLRGADVRVTLVDRRNYHLFQPLLYQVATGGLSPANIAAPLRGILSRQKNCQVLLGEVVDFDVARKAVILADGELEYDMLVVAAGASHSYFGNDAWQQVAPGLKTIEDAARIRRRVFLAFEAAEREMDPEKRRAWMTFAIVGAGPTGVELAGALAEIARHTLRYDFRHIDPGDAQILLIEAGEHVLSHYPPELCQCAKAKIEKLGIDVLTRTKVTNVAADHVSLSSDGSDGRPAGVRRVATHTVVWAAGVQANALGRRIAAACNVETDRIGRVPVLADLTVENHPDIFVIGDIARCANEQGQPLPGLAPVAIQQGHYVSDLIKARMRGNQTAPFRYRDHGTMATIGRAAAVAKIGKRQFCGFFAWLIWLAVHLMQIIHFQNRVLVLFQWAWNYSTYNRSARLITETPVQPPANAPPLVVIEKSPEPATAEVIHAGELRD